MQMVRSARARGRKRSTLGAILCGVAAPLLLFGIWNGSRQGETVNAQTEDGAELPQAQKLAYIQTSGQYNEDWIALASKRPESIDSIYEYPALQDSPPKIDLSREIAEDEVPLLLQWDGRWGWKNYGAESIASAGCGPTTLSMAALYLTRDARFSPDYVARLAAEGGYYVDGVGSTWTLISEGAKQLGLLVRELPLDENSIKNALDNDDLVLFVVGEGRFTESGHFMLLTGYDQNGFYLNDSASTENSQRQWRFDELCGEIKNLWQLGRA